MALAMKVSREDISGRNSRHSDANRIAVLIPCYNEEKSVRQTIEGFWDAIPSAQIYVYDNNSTDNTVQVAREAGAVVRSEKLQGKGYVVRRMFADVEADVYILADGDATYDPSAAPQMIEKLVSEELDMIVASRKAVNKAAYRPGHQIGNLFLTTVLTSLFGKSFSDILSGYRVFSRRFVKSFPVISQGFEIETEISVHALELNLPVSEFESLYRDRVVGSVSKLSTYRDGFRILFTIMRLLRLEKPVLFFGVIAGILLAIALGIGTPLIVEFYRTGLVPRLPTAVLTMGLVTLAFLNLFCGLILDTVVRGRQEVRRLAYLALPGPK